MLLNKLIVSRTMAQPVVMFTEDESGLLFIQIIIKLVNVDVCIYLELASSEQQIVKLHLYPCPILSNPEKLLKLH